MRDDEKFFEDILSDADAPDDTTPVVMAELDLEPTLSEYRRIAGDLSTSAKSIIVSDEKSQQNAIILATTAKKLYKKLEEIKKKITEPAREFIAKINAQVSVFTKEFLAVDSAIKHKLDLYQIVLETRREEEIKTSQIFVPPVPTSTISETGGSVYCRTEYSYEVEDISLVPKELLLVDDKKVKAIIKSGQQIPGIKAIKTKKTIVKSS